MYRNRYMILGKDPSCSTTATCLFLQLLFLPHSTHHDRYCLCPMTLCSSISAWVGLTGVGIRQGLCALSLWVSHLVFHRTAQRMSLLLRCPVLRIALPQKTPDLIRHLQHHVFWFILGTITSSFIFLALGLPTSSNVSPRMFLVSPEFAVGRFDFHTRTWDLHFHIDVEDSGFIVQKKHLVIGVVTFLANKSLDLAAELTVKNKITCTSSNPSVK